MIPIGVQLFILIVFAFLVHESNTPNPEPIKAPEQPEKPRIINIVDSVVQRSTFDMGGQDEDVSMDAIEVLRTLGYNKTQATLAVRGVQMKNPDITRTADIVKAALRKV